jgi:hypothetical protein
VEDARQPQIHHQGGAALVPGGPPTPWSRADTTGLAVDTKARRAIARAWNSCIGRLDGWPGQRLVEPPLKVREWPQWEDFPATLRGEFDSYLLTLTKPRRGADGRRLRACAASTLRTKRGDIIAFAKMAVRSGIPLETLTSLSALLDPNVVEETLDAYWKQDGEEPGVFTIDLAKKLFALAHWSAVLPPRRSVGSMIFGPISNTIAAPA